MSAQILDGKAIAAEIRSDLKQHVDARLAAGLRPPGLAVVLVGDNPASQVYVRNKRNACAEVGFHSEMHALSADTTQQQLLGLIDELNRRDEIDGILVQLPLPSHLDEKRILARVHADKDVDGFHPENVGRLWTDQPGFAPATPSGIIEILRRSEIPLVGSHAVIVGRSTIVGKPMGALLLRENCTVTFCHSRTRDLQAVCRQGDILVAAIGRLAFFGPEHVQEGATVIDVGINRLEDGSLCGDVDYAACAEKAAWITPVPGGVGPMTVATLLENTLQAAELHAQG